MIELSSGWAAVLISIAVTLAAGSVIAVLMLSPDAEPLRCPIHGRLLLYRSGFAAEPTCPVCDADSEDIRHELRPSQRNKLHDTIADIQAAKKRSQ